MIPIASLLIAGVSFAVTGGLLLALVMARQPATDSRTSVETLASTSHPSPLKAPPRSVSPSPGPSGQPWLIRVALFRPLPLKRIALGAGTVCRTRATVPERLSQTQISDGLVMGSLPPLQCRGGWIHLNGMGYRDGVEIDRVQQDWQIIQTVELERYVASVVGAEMPSHWHPDALRAQAIAARSYALTHLIRPASPRFHLGDTTRWQAYRGPISRSAAAVRAATETRGIVLNKDDQVVESLYAANRVITDEAHGHLGASMSQTGARELADQGLSYQEILGKFYPGTQLRLLRRNDG